MKMSFSIFFVAAATCLVTLVAMQAGAVYLPRSPPITNELIEGSSNAPAGVGLYQASLRNANGHFCGGAIIGEIWVLTAAHCTIGKRSSSIKVVVGSHSLKHGGTTHSVRRIITHDIFDPIEFINDICLLQLSKPIIYEQMVQPIMLPSKDIKPVDNLSLTGWGRNKNTTEVRLDHLQIVTLKTIRLEQCRVLLAAYTAVTSSQICAFMNIGKGTTYRGKGDAGGPLVRRNYLVGIYSFHVPFTPGLPDVYTRVYSYLDWIAGHMKFNRRRSS